MARDYWSGVLNQRLSRRRALAGTGALGGALLLAACGGGDSNSTSGPVDKSGLLTPLADETAKGVPGGIMPENHGNNPFVLDPQLASNFTASALIAPVYSTLVKFGKAVGAMPGSDTITGDAAESWEQSPDGLQVTYKLRANHTYDPRPPTNGRAMTTADVRFAWARTVALSPLGVDLLRQRGPTGPVDSLSTPDDRTIVIKLAEPYGGINETMAYTYFYVTPQEADGKFDPKGEMRGSGPFYMEKWEPSVVVELKKNPNWYVKNRPFLDGIRKLFITEAAAVDAQFEARALWTGGGQPANVLRLKKEHPELIMRQAARGGAPSGYPMLFGTKFQADVRLRRATSMLIDRAALIEAAYNTNVWSQAGLDVATFWDGHLSSNAAFNWLDPSTKDLGEGAQYFQYNTTEAKKLLSAAGYKGESVQFLYRAAFGPAGVPDILSNMIEEGGFKLDRKTIQANEATDLKTTGAGGFEGLFWTTANSYNDDGYLATKYTTGGRDRVTPRAIPGITDAVLKMRTELDAKKRNEMIRQIQKDLAMEMPDMPVVATQPTLGYTVTWPWLRNNVFSAPGFNIMVSSARPYTDYWIDQALQKQYGG